MTFDGFNFMEIKLRWEGRKARVRGSGKPNARNVFPSLSRFPLLNDQKVDSVHLTLAKENEIPEDANEEIQINLSNIRRSSKTT